jgi:hypothetical protein
MACAWAYSWRFYRGRVHKRDCRVFSAFALTTRGTQLYKPPRPTPTMLLSALREWDRRLEFLASSRRSGVVWTSLAVATCIENYVKGRAYTCWRRFLPRGYRVSIYFDVSEETLVDIYMDIVLSESASNTVTIVCCTPDGGRIGAPASVDCNSTEADCRGIIEGFINNAEKVKASAKHFEASGGP